MSTLKRANPSKDGDAKLQGLNSQENACQLPGMKDFTGVTKRLLLSLVFEKTTETRSFFVLKNMLCSVIVRYTYI